MQMLKGGWFCPNRTTGSALPAIGHWYVKTIL